MCTCKIDCYKLTLKVIIEFSLSGIVRKFINVKTMVLNYVRYKKSNDDNSNSLKRTNSW